MDMAKTGMIVAVVVALLSLAFMVSQAGGFGSGAALGSPDCALVGSGGGSAGNALTGNSGSGSTGAGSGSGPGAALAGGSCGSGSGGCGCGSGAAAAATNNQPAGNAQPAQAAQLNNGVQDVYIKALPSGSYDKPSVQVKAGVPVRFHFSADRNAGCGKLLLINEFGVRLTSYSGEESVAEFTPSAGTYQYHCGMYMFVGKLIVV